MHPGASASHIDNQTYIYVNLGRTRVRPYWFGGFFRLIMIWLRSIAVFTEPPLMSLKSLTPCGAGFQIVSKSALLAIRLKIAFPFPL